ncbi:P-loop NTPase fold protein [Thioclava sp. F36-6]|uniref:P-loop NTPase fold protein n=1 Tax=Thioclava sp. F36-6 TaxID=1915316 RepID=UPI0032B06A16
MEVARKNGFGLHFKRDSRDIALNAKGFALALARLFKNADGEFSFALFGRWGSGKTSIANLVSGYLEDPLSYKNDFRIAFNTDPMEGCDHLKYKTVHFNAWRYRQKPELWVYLYESFLVEYLDCNFFERIAKTVRVNLHKIGVFQALFSLFVLALAAFPLMWISLIFPYAQAVFGVAGSIGLVLLAYRWKASLRHLYDQYGVIKSHREHLGMQAVIGLDLQILLTSWSKTGHFKTWEKNALGFGALLVSLAWLSTFWTFASFSIASLTGWLIWSLVSAAFWISGVFKIGGVDRILLVIDDLDRCPEEEIVDLIDGIKLMIDDEEIGKVVQVLVLADDTVLDAAVRKRFEALSSDESDVRWIEAINEHMEKVFLCHVHLPKLTQANVVDLVDVYAREFGLEPLNADQGDISEAWAAGDKSNYDVQHDENSAALQTGFVITQEEQEAIREALQKAFENAKSPVTPRFVRSFLYKYQLVRMLLQLNNIGFETYELAHSLVEAVLWARSSVKPWKPEIVSQTTHYIRMVA